MPLRFFIEYAIDIHRLYEFVCIFSFNIYVECMFDKVCNKG